jgi:hypothetical protein
VWLERIPTSRGSRGGWVTGLETEERTPSKRKEPHPHPRPHRPHAIHHSRLAPGSPAHAHIDDRQSTIDTSSYASVDSPPRRRSSPAPEQTPMPSQRLLSRPTAKRRLASARVERRTHHDTVGRRPKNTKKKTSGASHPKNKLGPTKVPMSTQSTPTPTSCQSQHRHWDGDGDGWCSPTHTHGGVRTQNSEVRGRGRPIPPLESLSPAHRHPPLRKTLHPPCTPLGLKNESREDGHGHRQDGCLPAAPTATPGSPPRSCSALLPTE